MNYTCRYFPAQWRPNMVPKCLGLLHGYHPNPHARGCLGAQPRGLSRRISDQNTNHRHRHWQHNPCRIQSVMPWLPFIDWPLNRNHIRKRQPVELAAPTWCHKHLQLQPADQPFHWTHQPVKHASCASRMPGLLPGTDWHQLLCQHPILALARLHKRCDRSRCVHPGTDTHERDSHIWRVL